MKPRTKRPATTTCLHCQNRSTLPLATSIRSVTGVVFKTMSIYPLPNSRPTLTQAPAHYCLHPTRRKAVAPTAKHKPPPMRNRMRKKDRIDEVLVNSHDAGWVGR